MDILDMILGWFTKPLDDLYDFLFENIDTLSLSKVFFIEGDFLESWGLKNLYLTIFLFSMSLLTLKLLWKIFNVYVLGVDGDNSNNPLEYMKGYGKGIAISLGFSVAYQWLAEIVEELEVKLSNSIDVAVRVPDSGDAVLGTLFTAVYTVMVLILYIHMLTSGCRMLVLRLCIPFACTGLMDSDNGVYAIFMKKIFQTAATVLVQLLLIRISMAVGMSSAGLSTILLAIALGAYSFHVTQDMNDVFMLSSSSGIGQKASSFTRAIGYTFMRGKGGGK